MKNRKREICTSGTVRDEDGNVLIYSANDRGDRRNVGIIRSPIRASILPDQSPRLRCRPPLAGIGRRTPIDRVSTADDRPISLHALFIAIIITRACTSESVEPAPWIIIWRLSMAHRNRSGPGCHGKCAQNDPSHDCHLLY
jgi:hypothetical protein